MDRNTTESTTAPAAPPARTASAHRGATHVNRAKSVSSDTANAAADAAASWGPATHADSPTPAARAASAHVLPRVYWVASRRTRAAETKYTPAGARRPKPTGTTPKR